LVEKCSTVNVYNALALPIVLCGIEMWTHMKKYKKGLTKFEMKIFRRTAGYTIFYHNIKEEFLEELKEEPVDEKLRRYKSNWLRQTTIMNNRMPKIVLKYG
jgi:hypothetical protein